MSESTLHRNFKGGQIHVPHTWEFADAAAREASGDYISTDLYKFALQLDDKSLWLLTAVTPTWKEIGKALPLEVLGDLLVGLANGVPGRVAAGDPGQYLTWDAQKNAVVQDLPATGNDYLIWDSVLFDTPGSFDWTVSANVTKAVVEVQAGGAGSESTTTNSYGDGGGYGAYIRGFVTLTPGETISGVVGDGGLSGIKLGRFATAGGPSSFGSLLSATGGQPGGLNQTDIGYGAPGEATCATSGVVILEKSLQVTGNNGPRCMEVAGSNQAGKLYGGGAGLTAGTQRSGQAGAQGFVRIWYVED